MSEADKSVDEELEQLLQEIAGKDDYRGVARARRIVSNMLDIDTSEAVVQTTGYDTSGGRAIVAKVEKFIQTRAAKHLNPDKKKFLEDVLEHRINLTEDVRKRIRRIVDGF